jgi:hypothetical protein
MNQPISKLDPRDPKYCLSVAARVRIDVAHLEGSAIRARVQGKILARHNSLPEPKVTLGEYWSTGHAAIEPHEAYLEYARLVMIATARELWAYGKSSKEINAAMDEEIEGAVYSLELSLLDRDFLKIKLSQLLRKLDAETPPAAESNAGRHRPEVELVHQISLEKSLRKRGPKTDFEGNRRMREIIEGDVDWRTNIEFICERFDAAGIPLTKKLGKYKSWEDAVLCVRSSVVKAVEYRLSTLQG